ncbi:hypothetical protein BDV40DRAFT_281864 [Aspergillus tamarii]|uniref:Uncharacterized protein n=1 Tax=Aspergillus tamarii TaxID=41984 RepID=A0A5N6UCB9_ASPTM|nr:hypothetical protein BDV40DRAFT_281864 [Aspergillus tamarii]
MNASRFFLPSCKQLRLPILHSLHFVHRFPVQIGRTLYPVKRQYFHPVQTTMSFPSDNFRPDEPSKRDPTIDAYSNQADQLERLLQQDGLKSGVLWFIVIYIKEIPTGKSL